MYCLWGGVTELPKVLEPNVNNLAIRNRREVFLSCRQFAIHYAPLEMWRRDPAIALCLKEIVEEPCTPSFTLQTKARIIHEVLHEQGIEVKITTIRKVLDEQLILPDTKLLELYTTKQLWEMRSRASAIIAISRKEKRDAKRFEDQVWKNRITCIHLAEAITQGASVRGLCAVAKKFGYEKKPEFFQAFLRRTRVGGDRVKTEENREAAVESLRELHGFNKEDQAQVQISVSRALAEFVEQVQESIRFQSDLWKHKEACAAAGLLFRIGFSPDSIASFMWRYYKLVTTSTLFSEASTEAKSAGEDVSYFFLKRSDAESEGKAQRLLTSLKIDQDSITRDLATVLSIANEGRTKKAFELVKTVLHPDTTKRTVVPLAEFQLYNHNGVQTLRITTNAYRLRDARAEKIRLEKYDEFMYFLDRLSDIKVLKPPLPVREFFKSIGVQNIELRTVARKLGKENVETTILRIN